MPATTRSATRSPPMLGCYVVGAMLLAPPAVAQSCDTAALGARFTEAAALCADQGAPVVRKAASAPLPASVPDAPAVATAAIAAVRPGIAAREPVSIQMTGYRRRLAKAVATVEARRGPVDSRLLNAVGQRYRIDPRLLASIVHAESAGRPTAVSNKGALGLMQVMPGTARGLGVRDPQQLLGNPALALSTGAVYLKQLQRQFGNNVPLVLAAYNAGPGAVIRAGRRVPRYRETQGYVAKIMGSYTTRAAAARR